VHQPLGNVLYVITKFGKRLLYANLIAQSGIIVTGAIVRLTGSGLGCPTWPQCAEGSFTPTAAQAEGFHKWIEFGNRLLTFVLAAIAISVLIYGIKKFRNNRALLLLSIAPLAGTVFQAVLGGITVLTQLNPFTVMAHFLVSILLVALAVALIWKAENPQATIAANSLPPSGHYLVQTMFGVGLLVIILGTITTGSGPHSGDTEAARFNLDVRSMAWLHADAVWLFMGLLIGSLVLAKVVKASSVLIKNLQIVLIISLIQGLVGYSQWFSGLPWALVAVHVALAVILWIFLTKTYLSTREALDNSLR
jgi:cytochrome c oxidase assembly protein subunit 15